MKTLPRKVTKTFFINPESGFSDLEKLWSELVSEKLTRNMLTVEYHLLYQILRGKDFWKSFSDVVDANKLDYNGMHKLVSIHRAIESLKSMIINNKSDILDLFGTVVSDEGLQNAIDSLDCYTYKDESHFIELNQSFESVEVW